MRRQAYGNYVLVVEEGRLSYFVAVLWSFVISIVVLINIIRAQSS